MKDQNKIQKAPETKLSDEQLRDVNAGQMASVVQMAYSQSDMAGSSASLVSNTISDTKKGSLKSYTSLGQ